MFHSVIEKLITIYDLDEKIWHSVWPHQQAGKVFYFIGNIKKGKFLKLTQKYTYGKQLAFLSICMSLWEKGLNIKLLQKVYHLKTFFILITHQLHKSFNQR